jgi:predicted DNA-binding protein with PD1-like motif
MKHFLFVLAVAAPAFAQPVVTEIVRPTTPEQDARANSDDVPDVLAMEAKIERVVILRFKYQADLLAGIERAVRDKGIKNAVIISGIGSVRNFHVHSVSNRTFPSKNVFIKDAATPADIVSVNGYVIGGRVHAHLTMTDKDKAFGGHLEPGTNVFTFAILTLGVLPDSLDLSRLDDKTFR